MSLSYRNDPEARPSHVESFSSDCFHLPQSANTIHLPIRAACGQEKVISIQLADSEVERSAACTLINKMYSWRGYGSSHKIPLRLTNSTFTASVDGDIIGTLTLAVDSAAGLAADHIFRDEIDVFRQRPGARVCELTKLAFDSAMPSKPTLAALFHIVFICGQQRHQCTDLFIEVNPRHRRFYEVMLGFERIGTTKTNASVNAPSQLMHLRIANIRHQIDRHAGQGDTASVRSLYPFFFSPREESGIYRRITGGDLSASPFPCGNGFRPASC